ncbi:MAG TPA: NAD(P)-dependent oxidoreductase [Thermoleophilaceae bacterium]|jgi:3-hydroxyisobutyrate dehydrogenase-like beta-hydroxyacid dehydrogenase|nr:NAD(P)-dependent oxidoreductase [Thermoleophilaceae bacterium]
MDNGNVIDDTLGWAGTGRMGYALAKRLLEHGFELAVYNRTRSKAEPLADVGACTIVDTAADLADREIVFTMGAGDDDFRELVLGPRGLLSREVRPRIIVDSTTVSAEVSAEVRAGAERLGTDLLVAPVSGNPRVVEAGKLTYVVSGPEDAYRRVLPYLELLGAGATYVGEGELARLAKICHNLLLGTVAQSLAEISVLAEKGGMSRAALFEFLNKSVMGSMFTRYKTPAYVNLDFHATFTPILLRKDFDLGFKSARELDVPMPVAAATLQMVQALIGAGYREEDFATLLELQAQLSDLELESENAAVTDGLGADAEVAKEPSAQPAR